MKQKKKYNVAIAEVHYSHRIVEAVDPAEAKKLASDAEISYLEFSHTLDEDLWIVEEIK